ncbi:hypothetical protein MKY96_32890 [Paenibacillus sp. FSL R7-0302]|uniref:hypothetical protein n=1 Tax=Paenibacillus sp. FSL R7-0302 TaxID=2921681 RepID=UPI0030F9C3B5
MNRTSLLEDIIFPDMEEGILAVIEGHSDMFESKFLAPAHVAEHLKDEYGADQGNTDTNGWQWDYWTSYRIHGVQYMLSGSAYFGNLKFFKNEDGKDAW